MSYKTLGDELKWFFIMFGNDFRQGKQEAFETLMLLAVAHCFKWYNPKEMADFLGIPYQRVYAELQTWSLYYLREMLVRFLVHQAEEDLIAVSSKSAATTSRAGITLSVDNSVIDRMGKMLRCTWSWYSGRWKKVVTGQDLLGIVLPLNGNVVPLYVWFCSKQGRDNTDKPSLFLSMLTRLTKEFTAVDVTVTEIPIPWDSWFVSDAMKQSLRELGFTKIIIAGKGNYGFTIGREKHRASVWKPHLPRKTSLWGIDVAACRVNAVSPTFGKIVVFFSRKSPTRNYYLMDFSPTPWRGAEIWHIWKQHVWIEWVWKMLKTVFKITSMRLRGIGLYPGLLVKVLAYLLVLRLKSHRRLSQFSFTRLMRQIQREGTLEELMEEHFHLSDFFYRGQKGQLC
jgi:hypothetical protein